MAPAGSGSIKESTYRNAGRAVFHSFQFETGQGLTWYSWSAPCPQQVLDGTTGAARTIDIAQLQRVLTNKLLLKPRHIRDELARKAGMTSDTLWEPQEVGEGWLGVPG
jgi:hypothetical protein